MMTEREEVSPDLASLIELYQSGAISLDEFKAAKAGLSADAPANNSSLPPDKLAALDDKLASGCMKGVVGFVVLIAVIFGISMCNGNDNAEPAEPSKYEAEIMCEDWVKNKLKSPSTAKFSGVDYVSKGASSWEIAGAVDSQNGFGAMVRTAWFCNIKLDGDTWRGDVSLQ